MKTCCTCRSEKPISEFGARRAPEGNIPSRRCKACAVKQTRAYRDKNPNARRDHYRRNKVRVLAQAATYRAAHKNEERKNRAEHYQRNKEHNAKTTKAYALAHPWIYREAQARRRAAARNRIPPWADRDKIKDWYMLAQIVTEETGIPHEVDHIVPLQGRTVSGLHWEGNMQVITQAQNRAKSRSFWPDM